LPADPEVLFYKFEVSGGEWWPKEFYTASLDRKLQDKWCLSKEDIEKEEGLSS
jgi:hypothetical protein